MKPLQILLVDDDAEIGMLMKLRLSNEAPSFSFHFVEGGKECLEYIGSNSVDCILSDYQMPGMNGMDLLFALRGKGNDVPFIFLTGQGNEEVAREAFRSGAYDYFTKEMGFAYFTRIINSIEQAVAKRTSEAERRMADKALLESEIRYRKLFECAGDAIFILDIEGEKRGRIIDANQAAAAMHGYTIDELLLLSITDVDSPDSAEEVPSRIRRMLNGEWIKAEIMHKKKDGTVFPVEISAGLLELEDHKYALAIDRDISDHKKAEQALTDAAHFMNSILNSIQDGISVIDKDMNIICANPTLERWYSHNLPLVGRKCYGAFQNRDRICDGCPCVKAMAIGKSTFAEVPKRDINGEIVGWLEMYNFPLSDNFTGECKGAIEYIRDITEIKTMEKQKSDFYAMLSHDIKTPLTTIVGYTDLLAEKLTALDTDSITMLNGIRNSSQKIRDLVENFLSVSKMEAGMYTLHLRVVDISQVLKEVYNGFKVFFEEKGVTFSVEISDDLPAIMNLDKDLVNRAVTNLLQNASNYTHSGGNTSLKAEKLDTSVVISVSDTGPGIPVSEQDRIFDKYYQFKKDGCIKGTGLGLAIVKAVAEAHGGRVELISEEGKGSTFMLVLPIV